MYSVARERHPNVSRNSGNGDASDSGDEGRGKKKAHKSDKSDKSQKKGKHVAFDSKAKSKSNWLPPEEYRKKKEEELKKKGTWLSPEEYKKKKEQEKLNGKKVSKAYFIQADSSSDSEASSSEGSPDDEASSPSGSESDSDAVNNILDYNWNEDARHSCQRCGSLFEARNELFRHIAECDAEEPSVTHQVKERPAFTDEDVVHEQTPEAAATAVFGGYTYQQIRIRTSKNAPDFSICTDTGTGKDMISQKLADKFLEETTDAEVIEVPKGKGVNVKGWDSQRPTESTKYLKFSFYADGVNVDGTWSITKKQAHAWIVPSLDVGCLLGTAWLKPRQAIIDFGEDLMHFPQDHFAIPFTTLKRGKPVVRKVTNLKAFKLAPGETAAVPVNYTPLPKGRSFLMAGIHPTAVNAITDASCPALCVVHNVTDEEIKIPRKTRLATIQECIDQVHSVVDYSQAKKFVKYGAAALAATGIAMSMANGSSTATEKSLLAKKQADVTLAPCLQNASTSLNPEFAPTDEVVTLAMEARADPTGSSSPLSVSDAVFAITQGTNTTIPDPEKIPKPAIPSWIKRTYPSSQKSCHNLASRHRQRPLALSPIRAFISTIGTTQNLLVLQDICNRYDIWDDKGDQVDVPEERMMRIPLVEGWEKQAAQLRSRAYPVSRRDKEVIDKAHDKTHEQGRMTFMTDPAPFAFPCFVVWRRVHGKDKARVVVDLRPLNKVSVPDAYPLPLQQDVIDSLRGKLYITVIDATSFFFQFLVHPLDRRKLVIKSHVGYPSVELLGFYVDSLGLSNTQDRIQGFKDWQMPTTLKELESYIGAAGWLRTMIAYFAQLAEPLQERKNALLTAGRKSGKVESGNLGKRMAYCRAAKLTKRLRLYHADPDRTLYLQVDGSLERGFGVMLYHLKEGYVWDRSTKHVPAHAIEPIAFLSRCLSKTELNYGPSELEVACLVWATKKLRTTLLNANKGIVVLTDHESTMGIVSRSTLNTASTDKANRRLISASIYLSEFKMEVLHIPGKLNLVPDALSRLPVKGDNQQRERDDNPVLDTIWDHVMSINESTGNTDRALLVSEAVMAETTRHRFMEGYLKDTVYRNIMLDLATPQGQNCEVGDNEAVVFAAKEGHPFRVKNGLLYSLDNTHEERLVVPKRLVPDFLQEVHDDTHHFGKQRMMEALKGVHIRNKRRLVEAYTRDCAECQKNRQNNQLPVGTLQPILAPEEPMSVIAMDFITGLPVVPSLGTPWANKGFDSYNALLTVTDKTSKRTLLIPGHDEYKAKHWAEQLGRLPHEFLFGFQIPGPLEQLATDRIPKSVAELRFMREYLRKDAEFAIKLAAAEQKRIYDAKHRPLEFKVGDQVWLNLGAAYKPKGKHQKDKLKPKRQGPYTVIRKVSPLAYELDFSECQSQIHPVISIQHLAPFHDDELFNRTPPPPGPLEYSNNKDFEEAHAGQGRIFEAAKILDREDTKNGKTRYLVRWKGYGPSGDTWEPAEKLSNAQDIVDDYNKRQADLAALKNVPKARRSARNVHKEALKAPETEGKPRRDRGRPRKNA
ncbi:hypothetical protein RB595_007933 [Gaeumannomyces hyphopodioides]